MPAKKLPFILIFALFIFSSCTSIPYYSEVKEELSQPQITYLPEAITWTKVSEAEGFEQISYKIKELNVTWTCVKIDLNSNGLKLAIEPSLITAPAPFSVKSFSKKNHALVAINTTPFYSDQTLAGITKIQGELFSKPVIRPDYAALGFFYDSASNLRAEIKCPQSDFLNSKYQYAIGGFFQILKDGEINTFKALRRSRSACGSDIQGRYLYIFAATPDFNLKDENGLSYQETALILKTLGCYNAMQFDGGHSTALTIKSKYVRTPLFHRKVPAALGIIINSYDE